MVSKKFKIDFKFNSNFPINTIKLMRGCLIFNNDQLKEYINLIFDAYWKDNKNINDQKVLTKILDQIDVSIDEFTIKIEETEVKEKLKTLTNDAFKRNIFGDLYIRATTEVPVSLTKEQKGLLEQFKKLEDTKTNPIMKDFFEKAKRFWKN